MLSISATAPRRQSADERREAVLEAAYTAFAAGAGRGAAATST